MADEVTGRDVIAEITPLLSQFRPFCLWDIERDGSVVPYVPIPTLSSSSTDFGNFVSITSDAEMIETLSKGIRIPKIPRTEFKFPISFSYLPMGRNAEDDFEEPILPRVWECEDLEKSILDLVPVCEMPIPTAGSSEGEKVEHELLFLGNREMCKHNLHALKRKMGFGFNDSEIVAPKQYASDWEQDILQRLKEMTRDDGRDLEVLLERVKATLNGRKTAKPTG